MKKALWACLGGTVMLAGLALGQDAPAASKETHASPAKAGPEDIAAALQKGVSVLLKLQEGSENGDGPKAQWPYEGVYRVNGKIPIGYRVGGTAIVVMALVQSPGYAGDEERAAAVARAVDFLCEAIADPDMSTENYQGGYDVRCWGDIEAVACLCRLKRMGLVPEAKKNAVEKAMAFYLDGIHKLEMPKTGGWNYARPAGRDAPGAPSSFVTGVALQSLFEAAEAGYVVDAMTIERGLSVLETARAASGAIVYSGAAGNRERQADGVPGAVGRMNLAEATLLLAGRGSVQNVRGAVDAFIVHWDWLNKRRAKPGTHQPPYMVAPYYFMFAHHYAAQAVELLPKSEREEYRRRVNELLFSVRQDDGSWNDRVFPRSAGYGTAMAMLAMMQPQTPAPRWHPEPKP
ncbi:MAG: hypothetical protein JSR77_05020 [Planctomycetes bacterium]|nr:hypothetical protein [Planctomycetota bacterium]